MRHERLDLLAFSFPTRWLSPLSIFSQPRVAKWQEWLGCVFSFLGSHVSCFCWGLIYEALVQWVCTQPSTRWVVTFSALPPTLNRFHNWSRLASACTHAPATDFCRPFLWQAYEVFVQHFQCIISSEPLIKSGGDSLRYSPVYLMRKLKISNLLKITK